MLIILHILKLLHFYFIILLLKFKNQSKATKKYKENKILIIYSTISYLDSIENTLLNINILSFG